MAQERKKVVHEESSYESGLNITSRLCYDESAPGRDSDCTKYSYLCENYVYYNLMTWQCPVTCDRCSDLIIPTPRTGIFANGTCTDLKGPNGRSDCRKYIILCRDPRYVSLMANECPESCKYCP
ncbi:ShK domain-like family protein [Acanthocheilonema viteae]